MDSLQDILKDSFSIDFISAVISGARREDGIKK